MLDSTTHTVKLYTSGNKNAHRIITQYTIDKLQLAAMYIVKASQGEEMTVSGF
jgi:hypothetical protein